MTEAEWLATAEPESMLDALCDAPSERKLRLFAVACCRRIWPLLADDRSRRAVELTEAWADDRRASCNLDQADLDPGYDDWLGEVDRVWRAAVEAEHAAAAGRYGGDHAARAGAGAASSTATPTLTVEDIQAAARAASAGVVGNEDRESAAQAHLLRCIFGNPFRLVALDPSWLTSTAVALAAGIYDDRAFDRLPILADAFQDAGCDNEDILTHCRGPGPHVRGCWVVDLVLGKE
jgi:hypothetical protein